MPSFIQFGQVGKRKMFKQMFGALWALSVTIAHVDSSGQVRFLLSYHSKKWGEISKTELKKNTIIYFQL